MKFLWHYLWSYLYFKAVNIRWSYLYITGAIILAFILILLLWKVPQWQSYAYRESFTPEEIQKLSSQEKIQLEKNAADIENSTRVTLAQIIGGLALLTGLYFTYKNIRVSEEGNLTERFSKAVELLGSDKLDIRLGGIYALERIARDSRKDHWTVMEVLTAFVRENSHKKLESPEDFDEKNSVNQNIIKKKSSKKQSQSEEDTSLREDIQAIMTVIGRRKWLETETQNLNLQGVNLIGYVLTKAHLFNADLRGANLSAANLRGADLIQADLSAANLSAANLRRATLNAANLRRATLSGADLREADLRGATLIAANLSGADLFRANLTASLREANLSAASLREANLSGADLREADLREADLREAKLGGAKLDSSQFSH